MKYKRITGFCYHCYDIHEFKDYKCTHCGWSVKSTQQQLNYQSVTIKTHKNNLLHAIFAPGRLYPKDNGSRYLCSNFIHSLWMEDSIKLKYLVNTAKGWRVAATFTSHYNNLHKTFLWDSIAQELGQPTGIHWPILNWHYPHLVQIGFNPRTIELHPALRSRITTALKRRLPYVEMLEYIFRRKLTKLLRRLLLPIINDINWNLLYLMSISLSEYEFTLFLQSYVEHPCRTLNAASYLQLIHVAEFKPVMSILRDYLSRKNFRDLLQSLVDDLPDCIRMISQERRPNLQIDSWGQLHANLISNNHIKSYCEFNPPKKMPHVPGYTILHPKNSEELEVWSRTLHNCMSSYAPAIASGDTNVYGVFIDNQLQYGLEIRNGHIIQLLGACNKQPPQQVIDDFEQLTFREV